MGGTFKTVISERLIGLQKYLDIIVTIEGIEGIECFISFLDLKSKGLSGVRSQLGENKINIESFLPVKINKGYLDSVWKTFYVILLSSGSLHIFYSMYSKIETSLFSMSLTNDEVTIYPNEKCFQIKISSNRTKHKIKMKFPSQLEYSEWLRFLSNFMIIKE
jgi:hypothetical protein